MRVLILHQSRKFDKKILGGYAPTIDYNGRKESYEGRMIRGAIQWTQGDDLLQVW